MWAITRLFLIPLKIFEWYSDILESGTFVFELKCTVALMTMVRLARSKSARSFDCCWPFSFVLVAERQSCDWLPGAEWDSEIKTFRKRFFKDCFYVLCLCYVFCLLYIYAPDEFNACRNQKRASDPLELVLHRWLWVAMWLMGTKLGSLGRATNALNS